LSEDIDVLLDYLKQDMPTEQNYKEEDFLLNKDNVGYDEDEANRFKSLSIDCYEEPYLKLKKTNCYNYSRNLHYCYQQLMHLGFKKSKSKAIYFFNSGMSNCVILMALSYGSPNHDIGKPFMSVIKIKKRK